MKRSYAESVDFIMAQLPMYQRVGAAAYKANLNNTIKWLDYLGNPQLEFRSVHVAGTNGKGSVSHMLSSIFQEAGYKTGLYTSPHLTDFRERIRINGCMIEKDYVTRFINKHISFLEKLKPSFFEMAVGLCFRYFADKKVDVAIIETGMGGRLDSTNVIIPDLSVITNIGFDHTAFLGKTLKSIATEKAGIIKPGVPVVIGETHSETKTVFSETARKNKSGITFADQTPEPEIIFHSFIPPRLTMRVSLSGSDHLIDTPLAGSYQINNILTVLASTRLLRQAGYKLYIRHIQAGIAHVISNTEFKGRWMVLDQKPVVILDTGHNADGLARVAGMLKLLSYQRLHMVIGMVDDKDHEALLKLLPEQAQYYFCTPSVPRGFDSSKLSQKAKKIGLTGLSFADVESAVTASLSQAGKSDIVFIGGSTFTVADALNLKQLKKNAPGKTDDSSQLSISF